MSETIKAYKGFDKDLKCLDFQYEIGKEYEMDGPIKACESGFHACEMPLNVFNYYKPGQSRYCAVEQSGAISKGTDDTKVASSKIKIGAEIGIPGLVKAQIEWTRERADRKGNTTSGYRSSAATSGSWSSAATSGEESSAATSNANAIALACGKNSKAKGVIGSYIVLTEWDNQQETLLLASMVRIDGETYKPDTWYTLKDGEVVEAE